MGQLKFSNFAEKKKGQKDSKKYEFINGIYINTHIQYIHICTHVCVYILFYMQRNEKAHRNTEACTQC